MIDREIREIHEKKSGRPVLSWIRKSDTGEPRTLFHPFTFSHFHFVFSKIQYLRSDGKRVLFGWEYQMSQMSHLAQMAHLADLEQSEFQAVLRSRMVRLFLQPFELPIDEPPDPWHSFLLGVDDFVAKDSYFHLALASAGTDTDIKAIAIPPPK